MRLSIDDSTALASENFLENYDIFVAYNQNEIGLITDNNYEFLINVQGMKLVNLDLSDQEIANVDYEMASVDTNVIAFAQLFFDVNSPDGVDISVDSDIIDINFNLEPGVTSAQFDIFGILINDSIDYEPVSSARILEDVGLTIDPNTGEVTLLSNPDYEAQSAYSFTVTATDALGSASQTVLLNVQDGVESAPTVSSLIAPVLLMRITL